MRILFVFANSANDYIDIEREHRTLQRIVDAGNHSLSVLPAAELADLRDALKGNARKDGFDILHFSGHATEEKGLIMRAKGRKNAALTGTMLRELLRGSGVQLVVINACSGESLLEEISDAVPAAIGATRAIRDVSARRFTASFYDALSTSATVSQAFELALSIGRKGTPQYVRVGRDLRWERRGAKVSRTA